MFMSRRTLLVVITTVTLFLTGCQSYPIKRTFIDASAIPDQTYDVMVYTRGQARYAAVLFDIPDDGVPVVMEVPWSTHTGSKDRPGKYIDEFQNRVKAYQTVQISDENDTVRAYLVVSTTVKYQIISAGERIVVRLGKDPIYRNTPV